MNAETQIYKRFSLSYDELGFALFNIYIFMTYVAHGVIISSVWTSYVMYLFLGISAVYMVSKKTIRISEMSLWQMAFIAVSLLSMIYSPNKVMTAGAFYRMLVAFVLILCLSQYQIEKKMIINLCWTFSLSSIAVMLLLALTGNLSDSTGRLGADFVGSAITFGQMMMISCMFAIWLFIYSSEKSYQKLILISSIIVDYIAIFMSGGRKYIFIPIIFMYILLLFKRDRNGKKRIIKYTTIVGAISLIIYYAIMNIPVLYSVIGHRIENLIYLMQTGETALNDGSSSVRIKMIEGGLKKWLESPLWGYGFDSFKYYNVSLTGYFYYAHNNFVELLYDLGLIGFIVYYSFYIKISIKGIRGKREFDVGSRALTVALILSLLVFEFSQVDYDDTILAVSLFIAYSMQSCSEGKMEEYEK